MGANGSDSILSGPEGLQFKVWTSSNRPNYQVGQRMYLGDGRGFRLVRNGGTATLAGYLYSSAAPGANYDELVIPTAQAIGARTISITNGATAITADQFAEGYLNIEDDTGEGHLYRVAGNDAQPTTAAFNVYLNSGNGLIVAITTSTTVGLHKHECDGVVITPITTAAGVPVGVAPRVIPANGYGWVQFKGMASVRTIGTVIAGLSVQPTLATTPGAVGPFLLTEAGPPTEIQPIIGTVYEVGATTEQSMVMLNI